MDGIIELTGKINSDLTEKFPFKYFRGDRYIMVVYEYDINSILAESMKNCEVKYFSNSYKKLYNILSTKVLKPRFQKLYNEASNILIESLQDENIDFQLVPTNMHRRNASGWAIRKFKNHFTAILCSINPDIPLKFWDRLLYQETTNLNLMRKSIINTNLSTHEQLFGVFNFNSTPF